MHRGWSAAALACCALVALSRPLAAQTPASSAAVPDSARGDSLRRYALAPLVVTASLAPATSLELGFPISVLQRSGLLAPPAQYAADALTAMPGVSVEEASGPGGPTSLHLRGGDEPLTQMLFDGVPINISGGFNDIDGMLLTNVARIEVARGPLSALWGSSAVSGAVQYVTREGETGPPELRLEAEGGRMMPGDQARSELDVSGGSGAVRYSGGLGLAYDRGIFALPNDERTGDASLRLDITPAAAWSVTATSRYMAIQTNLPVRDPGATRVPLDPFARDRHYRFLSSVSAAWAPAPAWRQTLTASVLRDDFAYDDARDTTLDVTAYPYFVFNYNFGQRSVLWRPGLQYVVTRDLPLGTLSGGASWQREVETTDQTGDFGAAHTVFRRWDEAVFAEAAIHRGPLATLVGARLERIEGLPLQLLPRASLVLALLPRRLALRASAGLAFKAPNVDQQFLDNPSTIPNPGLAPERSSSWEVGAVVTDERQDLRLDVGWFRQRFDGLIETVPADTGTKATNKNLGATLARGLEVELERVWSPTLKAGANATWMTTRILDNAGLDPTDFPVGGTLPAIPNVTANGYVAAELAPALTGLVRWTFVGERTVLSERFSGQRAETCPYSVGEVSVEWHAWRNVAPYARLANLLNTRYMSAFDRPGVPRTVTVGARLSS